MKKFILLICISLIFVMIACSKTGTEKPMTSVPISNSLIPKVSSNTSNLIVSSSDLQNSVVVRNVFNYYDGTIVLQDGKLYFEDNSYRMYLPVLEEKCQIYSMVLESQDEISKKWVKEDAPFTILSDGLIVTAKVKTTITTKNYETVVEYSEIVDIRVYPPEKH